MMSEPWTGLHNPDRHERNGLALPGATTKRSHAVSTTREVIGRLLPDVANRLLPDPPAVIPPDGQGQVLPGG